MENLGRIIGENLKRLRSESGLSLDSLGKTSGVSKSRLGQIERGEANPSIATLWQIANALKVEFSTLVTAAQTESVIVSQADVEPVSADEGRYRVFPLFPFEPALGYEVFRAELEPGGRTDSVRHSGALYETVIIVSGELSMTTGGEEHALRLGNGMRFRADALHEYRNTGDSLAVFDTIIAYPRSS